MKGCSAFPKLPASLDVISRTLWGGGSHHSAEVQLVYSTSPVDWANIYLNFYTCVCVCIYIYIYNDIIIKGKSYIFKTPKNKIHKNTIYIHVKNNKCPGYDTKQSDGEVLVMLKLWRMRSTPFLPLLPGPLWPRVVAPDKGLIDELNRTEPWFEFTVFLHLNCVFMLN